MTASGDDGCGALAPLFDLLDALSDGEPRSVAALCARLGVGRTTLGHALERLEALGLAVERVPRRGVRLVEPPVQLDAALVERALGAERRTFRVAVERCVGSTNTILRERAEAGEKSGTCLAAEIQTAGRGRRGRTWLSGLGGALTFSVLWRTGRPLPELSGLSLAVGVAVVRALRAAGIDGAQLKWPNDIILDEGKLGGVLIELFGEAGEPAFAVIGIGLNMRVDAARRERIEARVSDLVPALGQAPDRNALLAGVLKELASVLRIFDRDGFAPLRREWMSLDAFRDSHVRLGLPDGKIVRGHACGVTEDGSLLLATARGVERFTLGEISLRPDRRPET